MGLGGAIIEAAGSLGSGLIGGLFNANQAKKNRQFQERMYNKQVEDNIKFWNMQNEYNLPSAQLDRLKQAGLNPLLMYEGQMQNVAQSAPQGGSLPSGSSASASFQNPFAGFGILDAQRKVMESQSRNLDTDSEKKAAEALLAAEQTIKTREEARKTRNDNWFNVASMQDRLRQIQTENRLKEAMANTEEWRKDEIRSTIELNSKNQDYLESQIYNNERLTDQQIAESKQRVENSIKETSAIIANLKAQERKAYADAWLAQEQARTAHDTHDPLVKKYQADVRKAILDGDQKELENLMQDYAFHKMPAPGSGSWKWAKWLENNVVPLTSAVGKILGGTVSARVGK